MSCSHYTAKDHLVQQGGVRIWICSDCEKRTPWVDGMRFYGGTECTKCGAQPVDRVQCKACATRATRRRP